MPILTFYMEQLQEFCCMSAFKSLSMYLHAPMKANIGLVKNIMYHLCH